MVRKLTEMKVFIPENDFDLFLFKTYRFLSKWHKKRTFKEQITQRDEDNLKELHKLWYKLNPKITIGLTEN